MLVSLACLVASCGGARSEVPPEAYLRVGVDVEEEAREVEATLVRAGWTRTDRIANDRFVALGFARGDARAIRVVTRRGVAVALDSLEPDGVRVRHGDVHLESLGDDVDGDGAPEVVVSRASHDERCLALLRVDEEGRVTLAADDAEALQPGSCVTAFSDVDDDGVPEALVSLAWPELAIDGVVARLHAPLTLEDGAWRARGVPTSYAEHERETRTTALVAARASGRIAEVVRIALELAALAHLEGATAAAQVHHFDDALEGVALDDAHRSALEAVRAVLRSGWGATEERDERAEELDDEAAASAP